MNGWNLDDGISTGRDGTLLFSQTLHLDALELCGMVFERFYKNWMYW